MQDFTQDIPASLANAAHAGTSFDPEKRGEQARSGYAAELQADYDNLVTLATTDEKRATLETEFARYRAGYAAKTRAWLQSKSRCVSWMIAGPSNFPVRRMEKRNEVERKRLEDLIGYRERALKAIRKAMCPELAPIMAGDDDAVARLTEKIAKAEALQVQYRTVNATIRKHRKGGPAAQIAALREALNISEESAADLFKPDFAGRIGVADYQLSNNSAQIRSMKARLEHLKRCKAAPVVEVEAKNESGIRLEDSPADNRVRIFFPGKPDETVRTALKSHGFRWTPSLGCWQAYKTA